MNSSQLSPGQKEVRLKNESFTVNGPVDLDVVKIEFAPGDCLVLASGATGRIGRVEIDTRTQDGIKVQNANAQACHDFLIEAGYVKGHGCDPGAHQDGIQVMGGRKITIRNVLFESMDTQGIFVNTAGSGATVPTDIVFDECIVSVDDRVTDGPATPVNINGSLRVTFKNGQVCKSPRYGKGIVVGSAARDTTLQNNTEFPVGQCPGSAVPPDPEPPDPGPDPEPDPDTSEYVEASWNLINASSTAGRWHEDNPGEWEKCQGYWSDKAARPVDGAIKTSFGKGLVALADAKWSI